MTEIVSATIKCIASSGFTQGPPLPVQPELDTEPFALFSRVFEQLDPLVAHEIYRTARDADIYFEEDDTADSGALHRFEVGFDSLAR